MRGANRNLCIEHSDDKHRQADRSGTMNV